MEDRHNEQVNKINGHEVVGLKNSDVIDWLHSREEEFLQVLEKLALGADAGFEIYKERENFGEFTGRLLRAIAAAVIEESLGGKYGDEIEVSSYTTRTEHIDDPSLNDHFALNHQIVRFRVVGSLDEWTVDATYRQFQPKVKKGKILIFPSKNENNIYTQKQALAGIKERYADNPGMIKAYEVSKNPPGKLLENYMEYAQMGGLGKGAVKIVEELLEVLRD